MCCVYCSREESLKNVGGFIVSSLRRDEAQSRRAFKKQPPGVRNHRIREELRTPDHLQLGLKPLVKIYIFLYNLYNMQYPAYANNKT